MTEHAGTPQIAGLLLAAGEGSRLGRAKALVEFDGKLLVERGVGVLADGGCDAVHVVLGAERDQVAVRADLAGALVVDNPDWAGGMASSLRAGLASLPAEVDAVVVALVDQPLIGADVVRRLRSACQAGARVAVATYHGKRRNPVLLGRQVWPEVIAATHDDVGARAYLTRHPEEITDVECADIADPSDVDTAADLRRVRSALSSSRSSSRSPNADRRPAG